MSIKENLQDLFKPREIRQAERLARYQNAAEQLEQAIVDRTTGKISTDEYRQLLDRIQPTIELDLRRAGSKLGTP